MKILAIDPGTSTGFAFSDSGRVLSGSANFQPKRGESGGMRLLRFHAWLDEILTSLRPDLVVYEMAHNRGGAATAVLNQITGKILELVEIHRQKGRVIEIANYHSAHIKKTVLGFAGKGATKELMVTKIKSMFPGQDIQDDDQGDALALLVTTLRDLSL